MSFLSDMIDKAKGFIDRKPAEQFTDCVAGNRFDRAIFDEVVTEAPALSEFVDSLSWDYGHASDMVADVYNQFHQASPRVRSVNEVQPSRLTNHAVATDVEKAPETENTRRFTRHDRYGSAMATLAVADKVKEFLKANDEVKEKAEEAEKAEKAAQEAGEQAASAAGDLEQAMGGYDGEGPLTEEQAQLVETLTGATMTAEQAQQYADDIAAGAIEAATNAQRDMRQSVREAVSETGKELEAQEELLKTWGLEDGDIKQLSFAERAARVRQLSSGKLGKYASMLGRFKHVADAQQARKVEYARDEIVDIELSGELDRMIDAEFMSSRIGGKKMRRLARLDFINRLADDELVSHKFSGVENVGKGAVICCVDTSGSMEGAPETWSKCFSLALLDQCMQTNRDFVGINFSSANQVKVFRFPKGETHLDRMIAFVEHFFDGGTDFEKPMDAAIKILDEEFNEAGKMRGDIVFITDDDCGVSTDWMSSYQERKDKLGFRVFGIMAKTGSKGVGRTLAALSDDVRAISDFVDPDAVADILRLVP